MALSPIGSAAGGAIGAVAGLRPSLLVGGLLLAINPLLVAVPAIRAQGETYASQFDKRSLVHNDGSRARRVAAGWLTDGLAAIFVAAGLSARAAATVAEGLVEADLRGIPSHGAMLVPMYVERLKRGSVSTREQAEVVVDAGAIAVLDAQHALGHLTGLQAMRLAVDKARRLGIGAVAVRHAFHFGGAFRYVEPAAAQGFIAIAAANTRPLMPAPGGASAVVGNNPLAVGIPGPGGSDPIVLDMALSEAALGKIRLAAQAGDEIPAGWATDAQGRATTDPQAAIEGLLLPIGGPKGFGLALVIDLLAGALSGGESGSGVRGLYADMSAENDCAHFFLALDVAAFGDRAGFDRRVAALTRQIVDGPRAPGVDRLLLPGQPEAERRAAALRDGIELGAGVLDGLRDAAQSLGVDLPAPAGARA